MLTWEREFRQAGGVFAGTGKGCYARLTLPDDPEFKKRAHKHIKRNSQPRGRPNMRVKDFQDFVNGQNEHGCNPEKISLFDGMPASE